MSDEIKNPEFPEETAEQLQNQTEALEADAAADDADDSRKDRPRREFVPKGDGAPRVPRFKKKVCRFCHDKALPIDYKRSDILENFITERGKILPRRITGTCARHQRDVAREIKRARIIALLPFVEK